MKKVNQVEKDDLVKIRIMKLVENLIEDQMKDREENQRIDEGDNDEKEVIVNKVLVEIDIKMKVQEII